MLRFWVLALSVTLFLSHGAACADLAAQLDALVAAYPDALARHDGKNIYGRDGTVMPVGVADAQKSFHDRIANATIADQFYLPYPKGRVDRAPSIDFDPGRFRNDLFFEKLYGNCRRDDLTRQFVDVPWFPSGRPIQVTRLHGVAENLKKVSAEIAALPDGVKRAAYPIAGVFSCRAVRDTGKMSMHAYAAAIDLNLAFSNYWLWGPHGNPGAIVYRNRMPLEIVDVFERHGFIWGGKWYHYDTMHFEYRPELLGLVP